MVFPAPNPPGTAAAPPFAIGNNVSMTRCPEIKGIERGRRLATGRGVLMGHFWVRVRECAMPWESTIVIIS